MGLIEVKKGTGVLGGGHGPVQGSLTVIKGSVMLDQLPEDLASRPGPKSLSESPFWATSQMWNKHSGFQGCLYVSTTWEL